MGSFDVNAGAGNDRITATGSIKGNAIIRLGAGDDCAAASDLTINGDRLLDGGDGTDGSTGYSIVSGHDVVTNIELDSCSGGAKMMES